MLEKVSLFSTLPPSARDAIYERFVIKMFPRHTVLINEGDESDTFFLLMAGRVKVYLADSQNHEVIITQQGEGFYFGELAYIGNLPRSASVMTLEMCRVATMPGAEFMEILRKYPDVAIQLIRELAHRLKDTTKTLRAFALLDVYGRLTRLLLEMSVEDETGGFVIHDRPTQQTMSRMVGASREMVGRILRELSSGGYIAIEGKNLRILRPFPAGW